MREDIPKLLRNGTWVLLGAILTWCCIVLFNVDLRKITLDSLLPKQNYIIEGKVTDKYGQPIAGAIVMVVGAVDKAKTKADGSYHLRVKLSRTVETVSMTCGKVPDFQPTEKKKVDLFRGQVRQTNFVLESTETELGVRLQRSGIGHISEMLKLILPLDFKSKKQ